MCLPGFCFLTTLVLGFLGGADDYLKLRYKNSKGLKARKKMASDRIFLSRRPLFTRSGVTQPSPAKIVPSSDRKEQIDGREKNRHHHDPNHPRIYRAILFPLFQRSGFHFPLSRRVSLHYFCHYRISNAVNLTDGLDGLAAGCL